MQYQHYLSLTWIMRAIKSFHAYPLILMTWIQPATIVAASALNIIKLDKLFIFLLQLRKMLSGSSWWKEICIPIHNCIRRLTSTMLAKMEKPAGYWETWKEGTGGAVKAFLLKDITHFLGYPMI